MNQTRKHRLIEPVRITAYSCISACGNGTAALADHLLDNRSGLGALTLFDLPFETPVGEVREPLPPLRPDLAPYQCRNAQLALAALDHRGDALRAASEAARDRYGPQRIGVIIGTSTSGLLETEDAYRVLRSEGIMPSDFEFLRRHAYQATPRFLQQELGLSGPCYAISTACSSSAKALATGQRLIANGVCDAVLAGGVDSLCRLTLRGFNSLELVSKAQCKPMDRHRSGINIGEAAALLLLEREGPEAAPRLLAAGESSDAHHMSHPHPQGLGAAAAMTSALRHAGLKPASIDYINMHATATPLNDAVEAQAVVRLFDDRVPCSATKGITGHTLGAAGALEATVALLALTDRFIPGTCGLDQPDPAFTCQIVQQPRRADRLQTAMSNVFGFGGNNISLILARADG